MLVVMVGVCVYMMWFMQLPESPRLEGKFVLSSIVEAQSNSKLAVNWSESYNSYNYTIREESNSRLKIEYIAVLPNPTDSFYRAGHGDVDLNYKIKTDNTIDILLHNDTRSGVENRAIIKVESEKLVFKYYFGAELIYTATYREQKPIAV